MAEYLKSIFCFKSLPLVDFFLMNGRCRSFCVADGKVRSSVPSLFFVLLFGSALVWCLWGCLVRREICCYGDIVAVDKRGTLVKNLLWTFVHRIVFVEVETFLFDF